MDELRACSSEAVELGRHEEFFGIEQSDFSYIAFTREQLEPIAALWQLASDWSVHREDWLDGELLQLQPYAPATIQVRTFSHSRSDAFALFDL